MVDDVLPDARHKNGRHALAGLFRQSVFGRLAGYEDVNDAEPLRHDPAMRWIVGGKAAQRSAARQSDGRFETQWLAAPKNFVLLPTCLASRRWTADRARGTCEKEGKGAIKWTRLSCRNVRRQRRATPASCARL